MTPVPPAISLLPHDFDRWDDLLALIKGAFAYMDGLIDPPSSATRLTVRSLIEKAQEETCYIAIDGGRLIGCFFIAERQASFYVGKLAIAKDWQGRGLGRALMAKADDIAAAADKPVLELQVRVELRDNQAAFARLGFRETLRTAHPGYELPTSITMQKVLT